MTNDMFLPFAFPAVASKKITAAFDGGRITSDGGVMVLAQAERRLAIAEKLAAVIADPRDPLRLCTGCRRFCGLAFWRSPAATRMPTISIGCALTPPSSWPADDCRIADWICVRSRPCHAGRTPRTCA